MSDDLFERASNVAKRAAAYADSKAEWLTETAQDDPHDLCLRDEGADNLADLAQLACDLAEALLAAEPFFRLAREVISPVGEEQPWYVNTEDSRVVFSFAGQGITLGDLRRAAKSNPNRQALP